MQLTKGNHSWLPWLHTSGYESYCMEG